MFIESDVHNVALVLATDLSRKSHDIINAPLPTESAFEIQAWQRGFCSCEWTSGLKTLAGETWELFIAVTCPDLSYMIGAL